MIRKIIFPVFFIIVGILFLIIGIKKPIVYKSEARCGGCNPGSYCSLNGEYCDVFHHCDGTVQIVEVYACINRKWTYINSQAGSSCYGERCGGNNIPTLTPGSCDCSGGNFGIHFKLNRELVNGESISCSVSGGGNCACRGIPCNGAHKDGGCTISAGQSGCYALGFDCSCKPFNYSCSGTASTNGSFSGGDVINAGSREVFINVPPPQQPTQPPPQQPTQPPPQQPSPTQPPAQTPTSTPQPTSTPTKTPTPTPTKTPTPTITPTKIPTQTVTLTPNPTETPTPNPTETPTPNPTETPTPTQSTNIISNPSPTPTEIIVVNQQIYPSPTSRQIVQQQLQPTIYQTGIGQSLFFSIPILIILLSLII